ncbi:MAG: bifunctional riboflavin kinase/FAD synthetase [Acidobacteria bacterium]|nr:bifunctional riboflavin kinase/FAD synthetase [Acidobacteriota bacterium]
MKIVESLSQLPASLKYPVMAIGFFDGIHIGHQRILHQLTNRAREKGGTSLVLTFHPHPQKIISPGDAPPLLLTLRQKEELLQALGIDFMVRLPFTRELSLKQPAEFVEQCLCCYGIREIHVGSNFRFGHKRSGDLQTLRDLSGKFKYEVFEVPQVTFRAVSVSSTKIRGFIRQGKLALVKHLLNRPYEIRGHVVRGDRRGTAIGFPTANLDPENELIPANGVYAGCAAVEGSRSLCVTNVGLRPTVDVDREGPVVETHLIDYSGELYGKKLRLDFVVRLRSEKKFKNISTLKRQIGNDIRRTRTLGGKLLTARK